MSASPSGVPLSFYYFGYVPNAIVNYVALAIFSLLFLFLNYRVFCSTTSPKYMLFLPFTAAAEIAGFAIRIVCSRDPDVGLFTAMTILLLISANFILLVNYKVLGDVVRLSRVETRYAIIGPDLAKTFFKSNAFATTLTTVGGCLQPNLDSPVIGATVALVGLALQLCFFLVFVSCVYYVDTCPDYQYVANNRHNPKRKLMRVMYVTMALMIVRTVYRLVNSIVLLVYPTDMHEWTFYIFDALMIALCFLAFCVWFVGKYLPSSEEEFNQKAAYDDDSNMVPLQDQRYPPTGYNHV